MLARNLLLPLLLAACSAVRSGPANSEPAPIRGAAAPPASEQSFRAHPPRSAPAPAFVPPQPEKRVLDNGLVMLVVPKRDLPLVAVSVVIRAGSADDGRHPGLAGLVGDMLRSGTRTRSAEQLAAEIETLGSSLQVTVDADALTIGATTLTDKLARVFDLVADAALQSTFPQSELERVRRRRLAAIAEERSDPALLADDLLREVVFAGDPYGHTSLGEPWALARLRRADLQLFFAQHLRPERMAVVVAGDVEAASAFEEIEKRFGALAKSPRQGGPAPEPPAPAPRQLVLVDRPAAAQSQVRVGEQGVSRHHPDYAPLLVMNAILGGTFSSRINVSLREERGVTYGAESSIDFMRRGGAFVVGAGVVTSATAASVEEILTQIETMRAADVTSEELAMAKNSYVLSLAGMFQTVDALAEAVATLFIQELPIDSLSETVAKVDAVTVADVRRVAMAHLDPERLSIVVVGDRQAVEEPLLALGRGRPSLRHTDGEGAKASE